MSARTTKQWEDCNNVFHIANIFVVSQQPQSIFILQHTSSRNFAKNVPIHKNNIIEKNIECFWTTGRSSIWTPRNLLGLSPSNLLMEIFRSFFLQSLFYVQMRGACTKEAQNVAIWLSCNFSIVRNHCSIFQQRFG